MSEQQDVNDALALLGVKLSPLAEMYADLHRAYTELLTEHAETLVKCANLEWQLRRLT